MPEQRYILAKDDDGHNYLVPANMRDAWNKWAEDIYRYWEEAGGGEGPEPQMPEGVIEIGCSIQLVTFSNVEIRGEPV